MLKVGLTGSIAVGKSFVVSVFQELGCVTFDADVIAHSVMEPGGPAFDDVIKEFGEGVLDENRRIDRTKLGAIVFADEPQRKRLNTIVHPRVIQEQDRLLGEAEKANPNGIAIIDAALMIESGGYRRFDKLVVVFCEREMQVQRLMNRNQISRDDAEKRIRAQMSSDEKRRFADFEIDTSGPHEKTRERVATVHAQLLEYAKSRGTPPGAHL